jgi:endonuclease III-like uncharacterized protein
VFIATRLPRKKNSSNLLIDSYTRRLILRKSVYQYDSSEELKSWVTGISNPRGLEMFVIIAWFKVSEKFSRSSLELSIGPNSHRK